MSSVKTTQIDGDISVGRNVSMGGKATVQGNMRVGHDLKVEGWLDAPNVKSPNKGVFSNGTNLSSVIKNPVRGNWAVIMGSGDTFPGTLYTYNGTKWIAGGTWSPPNDIDLSDYPKTTEVEEMIDDVTIETVDNLNEQTSASGKALDAHQGFVLAGQISELEDKVTVSNDMSPTSTWDNLMLNSGSISQNSSTKGLYSCKYFHISDTGNYVVKSRVRGSSWCQIHFKNESSTLLGSLNPVSADAVLKTKLNSSNIPSGTTRLFVNGYTEEGDSIEVIEIVGDLKETTARVPAIEAIAKDLEETVNGTEKAPVEIPPTYSQRKDASTTNRWFLQWDSLLHNGDVVAINCADGWRVWVGLVSSSGIQSGQAVVKTLVSVATLKNYTLNYQEGEGKYFRVIISKTDDSSFTEQETFDNVSCSVTHEKTVDGLVNMVEELSASNEEHSEQISSLTADVYGTEPETVVVNYTNFASISSTRIKKEYANVIKDGDRIYFHCEAGYSAYAGLVSGSQFVKNYTNGLYIADLDMTYNDGDGMLLRIIVRKDDDSGISYAEVNANTIIRVTRVVQTEGLTKRVEKLEEKVGEKQSIRILFIGNSLTQDAVSYVPLLMKDLAPDVSFKFYDWYNGGKNLTQQLEYFTNDTPCQIFSVCENGTSWTNFNNSKKMSAILQDYEFDIVCIQEYFNYKSEYSDADKEVFEQVVNYIRNHYSGTFKVVTLLHQPKRDTPASIYALTKSSVEWLLENTVVDSIIPAGTATYMALSTELDELGDQGHLSPDGTHSQEGLPCMLQAYVVALWIFEQLGIPRGILNNSVRVTAENYNLINVPGPNLGNGVVEGSDEQYWLAQQIATKAAKSFR